MVIIFIAIFVNLAGMIFIADSNNLEWVGVILFAASIALFVRGFKSIRKKKRMKKEQQNGGNVAARKAAPPAPEMTTDSAAGTASPAGQGEASAQTYTLPEDPGIPGTDRLMTGQLVAMFKKTHDERYKALYVRRLMLIGFTEPQAINLHMYELMTLKHDRIEPLCDPNYISKQYFDRKHVLLSEPASYYAQHQTFLVSELTKIWDEAEYLYRSFPKSMMPEDVWNELFAISRYGGGELFIEGLKAVSEHTKLPLDKLQAYSRAEQDLLFKYVWEPESGIAHPYGE